MKFGRPQGGFTVLELMVVVAIIAMATAGVGLAFRDGSQVHLERDGQRLSAALEAVRAQAQLIRLPVNVDILANGYVVRGPLNDAKVNRWLDADTTTSVPVKTPMTIVFGPEPFIDPQEVVLLSREHPQNKVQVATDGVKPFTVLSIK